MNSGLSVFLKKTAGRYLRSLFIGIAVGLFLLSLDMLAEKMLLPPAIVMAGQGAGILAAAALLIYRNLDLWASGQDKASRDELGRIFTIAGLMGCALAGAFAVLLVPLVFFAN